MGARTSYTAGTFCWTDLSTPDAGAAKAFYRPLLGWEYEDVPAGIDYTLALVDGEPFVPYDAPAPRLVVRGSTAGPR